MPAMRLELIRGCPQQIIEFDMKHGYLLGGKQGVCIYFSGKEVR
jgi:hypothetical protein